MWHSITFVTILENPVFQGFEGCFCEPENFVHNLNTFFINFLNPIANSPLGFSIHAPSREHSYITRMLERALKLRQLMSMVVAL